MTDLGHVGYDKASAEGSEAIKMDNAKVGTLWLNKCLMGDKNSTSPQRGSESKLDERAGTQIAQGNKKTCIHRIRRLKAKQMQNPFPKPARRFLMQFMPSNV